MIGVYWRRWCKGTWSCWVTLKGKVPRAMPGPSPLPPHLRESGQGDRRHALIDSLHVWGHRSILLFLLFFSLLLRFLFVPSQLLHQIGILVGIASLHVYVVIGSDGKWNEVAATEISTTKRRRGKSKPELNLRLEAPGQAADWSQLSEAAWGVLKVTTQSGGRETLQV
jgi:hypothetical protein